ncbi:MAG: M24 family metallopeptidase, partial [Arachnia sp.]
VGEATQADRDQIDASREAFRAGVAQLQPGSSVNAVSRAIEDSFRGHHREFGILRGYTGHGIGSQMHMAPDVPNQSRARLLPRLAPGIVLAIEPMITLGGPETGVLSDEWTVVSSDGSRGAHWENTVALTRDGVWVLTELDGGQAELTARGLRFAPVGD